MKTKPSLAFDELHLNLATLRAIDKRNQSQYSLRPATGGLGKEQIKLLTEGIFYAAFRSYEQFLRNVFLLYCCGIQSSRRRLVKSYLEPRTIAHAEELIKSSMAFLDWSSPDRLLERAESYLKDGFPIKSPIVSNMEFLREIKRLRNHISHMSGESLAEYKKVLRAHYGVIPLRIVRPGEFLLLRSRRDRTSYYLKEILDGIERIAKCMV